MKTLVKIEWWVRYMTYTILLTISWFIIYIHLATTLFGKIYITILLFIFILMHLDTFKILYKVFSKIKTVTVNPKIILKELIKK